MNILLTNDDGILAPGLNALYRALTQKGHQVLAVAPATEKSATSQAITVGEPLKVTTVDMGDGVTGFAVLGTPADCALLGLSALAEEPVDLVFSGINNGPNLGYDINYSGTVAAAIEAAAFGYPAIAVSLDWPGLLKNRDFSLASYIAASKRSIDQFSRAAQVAAGLADRWDSFNLPFGVALNVNVPDIDENQWAGETWIGLERKPTPDYFVKDEASAEEGLFFKRARPNKPERLKGEADEHFLAQGFVTLTPVRAKLCCEASLNNLKVC